MKRFFSFFLLIAPSVLFGHGFAGNTLIKDVQGWQDILQLSRYAIKSHQHILSYDTQSKQYRYNTISGAAHAQSPCYIQLGFDDTPCCDDILCTPTQAFYVADGRGWVPAFQLKVDDQLLSERHQTKRLKRATLVEEPLEVYSIEVQDTHTFFVSSHVILAHNMFAPAIGAAWLAPSCGAFVTPLIALGPIPVAVVGGVAGAAIIGFVIEKMICHQVRRYQLSYNTRAIAQSMRATALQCGARFEHERKDQIPACGTAKQFPGAPIPGPCMNDTLSKESKGVCGGQNMPEAPMPFCQLQMPARLQGTCGTSTPKINPQAREDELHDSEIIQAKSNTSLQNSESEDSAKRLDWTNHGHKHVPRKNQLWKDTVKETKFGDAKYKPDINIEELERFAWKNGTRVPNGKNWKVYQFEHVIGAKNGTETVYVRVEVSANTLHGHPITIEEFKKYTKGT